jgi:cyanophycin synthetase
MARLLDTRRLTGRNFLLPVPGAAAEVAFDVGDDVPAIEAAIRARVSAVGGPFGLDVSTMVFRHHPGGVSIAIVAPIDGLLTAADVLEVAIGAVVGTEVDPAVADGLPLTAATERNPHLLALVAEAERRSLPTVVDEEGLTIGLGRRGQTWPLLALPAVVDVPWSALGSIPVAMITGTNGKTTTTRLLTSILGASGVTAGATSTDGVVIGGVTVDEGDWSGPGGARRVVRDQRVGLAALETARGGLLRRGLAFEGYDVGVVTNIADDHLGEYGVTDLEAMASVKCLVGQGVRGGGTVVLNADDPWLMARVPHLRATVVLCGRRRGAIIDAHLAGAGTAWWVADHDGAATMVRGEGSAPAIAVIAVDDVPITFGGAAAYNVDNALAAAAAAAAMGINDDTIRRGLMAFQPSATQSAGRSNVLVHDGVTVLVDFAHNPAAIEALWGLVRHLRGAGTGKLIVCVGAPGDRLDPELQAFADAIAVARPDTVICRDMPDYRRGRQPGEVPALLAARLKHQGMSDGQLFLADDDVPALLLALGAARPGDVVVFTPLVDTAGVFGRLREAGFPVD